MVKVTRRGYGGEGCVVVAGAAFVKEMKTEVDGQVFSAELRCIVTRGITGLLSGLA